VELDEELGDELGTDAILNDASLRVAPPDELPTEALRTLALLTEADEIELTGIVALKF
jgi:hypothetical protein